ncbi:MAG: GTP-binding protein, partial [Spirulinaceae cyanobacterium]
GDMLILNKIDLAKEEKITELKAFIEDIKPGFRIFESEYGKVPLPLVLDIGLAQADDYKAEISEFRRNKPAFGNHLANDDFSFVSFQSDRPFKIEKFEHFLAQQLPNDVFRAKGILWFQESPSRHIFQLSGSRYDLQDDDWTSQPKNEFFPPYDRPGTKLFNDFCHEVIHRWKLADKVYPAKVIQILPIELASRSRFQLVLNTGETIIARRVVLATGSGKVQFPNWVESITSDYPLDKLCHSQQVNLNQLNLTGERILVVGGGLTSGHLTKGAINLGATVTLMTRKQLQSKIFDADPGWLGPKYLKDFHAETDWHRRYQQIQQARNGGSITPEMMLQLRKASREGKVRIDECCQVRDAHWQDDLWQVCCHDGSKHQFNRIWLATGTRFNVTKHLLLQEVLNAYPTEIVNGLPVLDEHLRLPKSNFFIMGGLAALQIGPVARNIGGGKMACQRIVPAIVKPSLAIA